MIFFFSLFLLVLANMWGNKISAPWVSPKWVKSNEHRERERKSVLTMVSKYTWTNISLFFSYSTEDWDMTWSSTLLHLLILQFCSRRVNWKGQDPSKDLPPWRIKCLDIHPGLLDLIFTLGQKYWSQDIWRKGRQTRKES